MNATASPIADGEEPVVSPELALVDPVLAAWARERLPDYPPYPPVRIEPPAPSEPEPVPAQPPGPAEADVIPFPQREPEEEPRRVAASFGPAGRLIVAAIVLVAAGLYAHDRLTSEHAAFSVVPAGVTPQTTPAGVSTTRKRPVPTNGVKARSVVRQRQRPAAQQQQQHATVQLHPATAKPHPATAKPKPATSAAAKPATRSPKRTAAVGVAPPRAFGWAKVPRATSYRVQFFRGPQLVYAATTTRAGLTLARSWTFRGRQQRFTPGTYRWTVQPVFGAAKTARVGKPIVDATLKVVASSGG